MSDNDLSVTDDHRSRWFPAGLDNSTTSSSPDWQGALGGTSATTPNYIPMMPPMTFPSALPQVSSLPPRQQSRQELLEKIRTARGKLEHQLQDIVELEVWLQKEDTTDAVLTELSRYL